MVGSHLAMSCAVSTPLWRRPLTSITSLLRQNASIHATEGQAERFEALLKEDPDVDHFSSYVGRGAIRFILTLNVQLAPAAMTAEAVAHAVAPIVKFGELLLTAATVNAELLAVRV